MTNQFINPYSFIPIPDDPPKRVPDDPPKRKNNIVSTDVFTGRICCQLEVISPIFIPNTSKTFEKEYTIKKNKGKKETLRGNDFFSYDDLSKETVFPNEAPKSPRLPGSEIRGMIRNIYEQLTNSCLSVIDEKNLTHMRTIFPKKPALWNRKENTLIECDRKKLDSNAKVCTGGTCQDNGIILVGEIFSNRRSKSCFFKKKDYSDYKDPNGCSKDLYTLARGEIEELLAENTYTLEEKDIIRFEKVLEEYKNKHSKYKELYNDPEEYPLLPVYYDVLEYTENQARKRTIYMSPACITREVFSHTISDILRENHFEHQPCDGSEGWCPACLLFGKIGQDGGEKALASRVRFCDSEIFDGDGFKFEEPIILPILEKPRPSSTEFYLKKPQSKQTDDEGNITFKEIKKPEPRIWNYDYYTVEETSSNTNKNKKTYQLKKVDGYAPRLSGRKVYWQGNDKHNNKDDQILKNTNLNKSLRFNQRTQARCLKKGKCIFYIFFEDLTKIELDQLIWCLTLGDESDCYHQIGRGKPLGMGRIKITLKNIYKKTYEYKDGKITSNEEDITNKYKNGSLKTLSSSELAKDILEYTKRLDPIKAGAVAYPTPKGSDIIYEWFVNNRGDSFNPKFEQTLKNVREIREGLDIYLKKNKSRKVRH